MTFHVGLDIDASRERVWRAFDNPDNLPKWQASLVELERKSGVPGAVGSVSRLSYQEGSHRIELVEVVTSRSEPEELSAEYDHPHSRNVITNRFTETQPGRTHWDVTAEIHLKGMARFMGPLLRGTIEHRVRTDCQRFKSLLESGALET